MKKTTNYQENKITLEMTFEEEAAIAVAIIGEIIELRRTCDDLKKKNDEGDYDEILFATYRRIETLEKIKKDL